MQVRFLNSWTPGRKGSVLSECRSACQLFCVGFGAIFSNFLKLTIWRTLTLRSDWPTVSGNAFNIFFSSSFILYTTVSGTCHVKNRIRHNEVCISSPSTTAEVLTSLWTWAIQNSCKAFFTWSDDTLNEPHLFQHTPAFMSDMLKGRDCITLQ